MAKQTWVLTNNPLYFMSEFYYSHRFEGTKVLNFKLRDPVKPFYFSYSPWNFSPSKILDYLLIYYTHTHIHTRS